MDETDEIIQELRESARYLEARGIDRGCQDSSISADLANRAADKIEALAKPAPSPAVGDVVREAAECLESLAGRVASAGGELDPTGPAQDLAWARRLLPKLLTLSQSTSAGRSE